MRSIIFLISCAFCLASFAQAEKAVPIEEQFDAVTGQWLERSDYLKTFEGINEYCQNPDFRK